MHRFERLLDEVTEERCFTLNKEFRDIRLSTDGKVKELQYFLNLVAKYKAQHPKSNLAELKLPHPINTVKDFLSNYTQYDPELKYAFIRALHGKFISSQAGRGSMSAGDRPVPLGWEVFAIEERKNGKVAIKSCGKYVSSENGQRDLRCDRVTVGAMELFDIIEHGNGIYSFKGSNGKYISSPANDETLTCNSADMNDSEKFYVEWMNDFSDEINIGWKYYDQYFTKLSDGFDAAVEEKKKIEPENYFIIDKTEVYHNDSGNSTHHHQRIFNQKEFEAAIEEANRKIRQFQSKLWSETSFLSGIYWGEKNNNDRIVEMSNELKSAYACLKKYSSHSITKK